MNKTLFEKLGLIASDIEKALSSGDFEAAAPLVEQHDALMKTLSRSGDVADMGMKDVIVDTEKKISHLISTIQTMQTDIRNQLSTMGNRRLLQSKYQSTDAR